MKNTPMIYGNIIVSLVIFLISFKTLCLETPLRFDKMSIEEGLSQNSINSILKDRHGFLWFATQDGLNRFDGYEFKHFRNNPNDENSISSNFLSGLLEDAKGRIWIGTFAGLNLFDPKTERFTHYQHQANDPDSLSNNKILSLIEDQKGNIWIGTREGGLNRFDPETGKFERFKHSKSNVRSLSDNHVKVIYQDSHGTLWVGTRKGLNKYNTVTGEFIRFLHIPGNSLSISHNFISSIFEDRQGFIWVGTAGGGLNKFNSITGNFEHFKHRKSNPSSISHDFVFSISEAEDGKFWIGTFGGGLNLFDPDSKQFRHFRHKNADPTSLGSDFVLSIFNDNQGLLWVGTDNGLNSYNPKTSRFNHVKHHSENLESPNDDLVWSIFEDDLKNLWVGTQVGLMVYKEKNDLIKRFVHDPGDLNSLSNNTVQSIFQDSRGRLWLGTAGGGMDRYNIETDQFKHYQSSETDPRSLSNNSVTSFIEDRAGALWIGTMQGLNKFNENGFFERYQYQDSDPESISNDSIIALYEDRAGFLWLGTYGGLNQYDPTSKKFKRYLHQATDDTSLSNNVVLCIYQDSKGILWIGTAGGLNKYQTDSDTFVHFSEKDGLANDTVLGILEDISGNLWLSTNKGLSRFNPKQQTFKNYDLNDGLQSNEFNSGVAFRSKDGEFFFGGINGFNRFFPDDIKDNSLIPPVVITDFLLFNQSVQTRQLTKPPADLAGDRPVPILTNSIIHTKSIDLDYTDSMFSFEFSALNYQNSNKNQYAYKMEGYDKDWITTSSKKRSATYTNLNSGSYIFRVKASNNDGLWNDKGTSIKINVSPPWWGSNLAYLSYALLSLLALYWVIAFRTNSLIRRSKDLQRSVAERTLQLSVQKQKIEQLLLLRDKDFANVSHEFRTPLTLILGPVGQMLRTERRQEIINRLKVVERNGYRLLRMVDQLLNAETFRIKSVSNNRIQAFAEPIREIVHAFSEIAATKQLEIVVNQLEKISFRFTKDALDNIVLNLLSNAIKYTPIGGCITIRSYRNSINELVIEVIDSGIGISPDDRELIFERFVRVINEKSEQVTGSGIGLALVKEIVENHRGHLEVESLVGSGSTFRVYLPIIDELGSETNKKQKKGLHQSVNNELISIEQKNLSGQLATKIEPQYQSIIPMADKKSAKVERRSSGYNSIETLINKREKVSHRSASKTPTEQSDDRTSLLIVEDDPDMRQYLVDCIGSNYRIFTAINGLQGISIATKQIPDLIISDLMMPKVDGIEMTRQLKEQETTSHIPIILLTARNDKKSLMAGLNQQANDFLIKPFDAEELLLRVVNLLSLQDNLRRRFTRHLENIKHKESLSPAPEDRNRSEFDEAEVAQFTTEHDFILKLEKILLDNFHNSDFNVENLAQALFISGRQLRRKVKALLAVSPNDFLRHYRLEKAAKLLEQGKSVGNVSLLVGYSSHSSFSQSFKLKYGVAPTEFMHGLKNKTHDE